MAISDDIFQLIKSMNRAEKAYFRRYALMVSAGKNQTYLKIFSAIEQLAAKNKVYNEQSVKKSLSAEAIKHFPVLKNNLYCLILHSLSDNMIKETPENKIKGMLERYDILYSKALFSQCRSILKKALAIAEDNELLVYHFILLGKEKVLARYTQDIAMYDNTINRIYSGQKTIIEKVKNNIDFANLADKYTLILQKHPTGFTRTTEDMSILREFMNNPLLQDEDKILTKESLSGFLTFKQLFSQILNDDEGSFVYSKRRLELAKERLKSDKSKLHAYIIVIYGFLVSSIRTGRFDEFDNAANELKNLPSKFPNMNEINRIESFYYWAVPELSLCSESLNVARGRTSRIEIARHFIQFENKLPVQQKIVLLFFLSTNSFIAASYEESLKWLSKLINISNVDLSQDYQCYARILNLLVHYELGNMDSLEYVLKSTYHFLSRRKKVYKYEKLILDYMRKSFRVNNNAELIEMFEYMRSDLLKIKDDSFERNAFDAFNLIPWLDSKIENISFIEAAGRL